MPIRADNISIADESTAGDLRTQQPGRAVNYNGTNQFSSAPNITPSYPLAFCGWINTPTSSGTNLTFFGIQQSTNHLLLSVTNGDFVIRRNGFNFQTGVTVPLSVWFHACVVFESDMVFELFINGASAVRNDSASSITPSLLNFLISSATNGGSQFKEMRALDCVVLDRQPSPAEIAAWAAANPHDATTEPDYGANVVGHWKLDDNSLTTGRDSSGNNNSLTHNNNDPNTTYESNLVPWSWPNMAGYSDGSGDELVPRNESNKSQDVDGNALDYTGRVPRDGLMINSPCVDFAGGEYGIISNSVDFSSSDWAVSFWSYLRQITGGQGMAVLSQTDGGGNGRSWIQLQSNTRNWATFIGGGETAFDLGPPTVGVWEFVTLTKTGNSFVLNVDGVDSTPLVLSMESAAGNIHIGKNKAQNSTPWDGMFTGFQLNHPSGFNLPMSEGGGVTCHDVSGNDKHAAIQSSTSSLWQQTQNLFHWSNRYGFSKLTHSSDPSIEVPNKTDGTAPGSIVVPTGYTNTGIVAPGFMTSDKTELDLTAGVASPFVGFYDTEPLETDYRRARARMGPPHYVTNEADRSKEFYSEAQ